MNYLRIRNWEKFQHYKDRKPTWIKLYVELLDDWEFNDLTDAQFGQLAKLWLLAARTDNAIPEDPKLIAHWIGADSKVDLEFFVSRRLLVRTKTKRRKGDRQRAANRYIPRDVRTHVLARDGYRCVHCSATLWLEIDHIKPVSKGGKSALDNLQTLCRSCNRQKRSTEQPATQTLRSSAENRSLEEEEETEEETPKRARRPRDEVWDTLVEQLGEPQTKSERGRFNRAVKELKDIEASPQEIARRCSVYRLRWPNVTLTPQALTGNWTNLEPAKLVATAPIEEVVALPEISEVERRANLERLNSMMGNVGRSL